MDMNKIMQQLIDHEGEQLKPYFCTGAKLTIGVGRNLEDNGISKMESRFLLKNDIAACYEDLARLIFPHQFEYFPEAIQHVLIDMRFQLGRKSLWTWSGTLKNNFKKRK